MTDDYEVNGTAEVVDEPIDEPIEESVEEKPKRSRKSDAVKALLDARDVFESLGVTIFLIHETLIAVLSKTLDEKRKVNLGVRYTEISGRQDEIAAELDLFFKVDQIRAPLGVVRGFRAIHKETGIALIVAAYFDHHDGNVKCPFSNGKQMLSFNAGLLENMRKKSVGGKQFNVPTLTETYLAETYDDEGNFITEPYRTPAI